MENHFTCVWDKLKDLADYIVYQEDKLSDLEVLHLHERLEENDYVRLENYTHDQMTGNDYVVFKRTPQDH